MSQTCFQPSGQSIREIKIFKCDEFLEITASKWILSFHNPSTWYMPTCSWLDLYPPSSVSSTWCKSCRSDWSFSSYRIQFLFFMMDQCLLLGTKLSCKSPTFSKLWNLTPKMHFYWVPIFWSGLSTLVIRYISLNRNRTNFVWCYDRAAVWGRNRGGK